MKYQVTITMTQDDIDNVNCKICTEFNPSIEEVKVNKK